MSSTRLSSQIYTEMASRDTQELLRVWQDNNRVLWSDQAFEAVRTILQERGLAVPPQGEPTYDIPAPPTRYTTIERTVRGISRSALLALFILWAVILAPLGELLGEFEVFQTLFTFELRFHLTYMMGMVDADRYLALWRVLSYIRHGIVCYGVYTGVSLLRFRSSAIFHAKVYLVQGVAWMICALILINVYPFAELLWGYAGSVMDVRPDWDTAFKRYYGFQPGWTIFLMTLKWYLVPLGCAVVWYIYFSQSAWIAERFSVRGDSPPAPDSR